MDKTTGPTCYVVTAYRWGQTNNHQYVCFVGTDRALALQAGHEECQGRGLKYGVEVVAWPAQEPCAYFPSSAEERDARGPVESAERIAEERLGSRVLQAFREGTRFAPGGDTLVASSGVAFTPLVKVPVTLPEWLEKACKEELELAQKLAPV